MNTIDASLRNTKTSGGVNKLRSEGNVPGIIYGGKSETQKISILWMDLFLILRLTNIP